MNDVLIGKDPNKHFFTNPFDKSEIRLPDMGTDQIMRSVEETQKYNKNITNIDPLYDSVKPLNKILIRMFIRESKVTKSNIFVGTELAGIDTIPVQMRGGSGQVYSSKFIDSPFKFQTKGLVIAVPGYEKNLKPGDIIAVPPLVSKALDDQGNHIVYSGCFWHPDSGMVQPTTDINNQHFGYCLLPVNTIECVIS